MQLTIIKSNKLNIYTLPNKIYGSHWITDFENGHKINLLNIEATENGWNLISNHDAFVLDQNGIMVPYVILHEYQFFLIKNNYKNEKYYLYCSPSYDTTYKELGINDKINVGSDESATISYNLGGIPPKAFSIEKNEKYYYLEIINEKASVYVNQKRVLNRKRIEYGDIIFMFGLKIILMRKNGNDYLLVNNPNHMLRFNAEFANIVPITNDFHEENLEISDDSIYKEENYFYRTPHFYKTIETFILNVDVPPQKKEEDSTPAALTIGPMITMAMTSIVTLISTLNQVNNGSRDWSSSLSSLVMCGAMLASCLLWPLLTKAYQKFNSKIYEHKRQKLYKKYINKKEEEIKEQLEIQRKILLENNFTVTDCQNIIRGHNVKLWQRRLTNSDFLTLPVGIGNTPMKIEIKYPEKHFSLEQDNLLDIAHTLGEKKQILNDVPITFSFYENKATGIVGNPITTKEFIDRLVLQMMANYSYDELKIVTFTSTENEGDWDYAKILPHSWSNDKTLRYFGSSNDDYREIIYTLEKKFNERKQNIKANIKPIPYYVIITDAIKSIDNYDFIKNIMASEINYGFSIIMLVDKVSALPNECKSFINVGQDECSIYSSVINLDIQKFKIDYSPIDEIYNCARELSNIPINIKNEIEANLPDIYQFLEMYQVGKIEQLNALDRWKKSNPMLSLQAPIGIGKSGEIIALDLHEKYHGPHGLIAGTTGSGKSELIITYILSLAINYNPLEVQIILIDYKGGSLTGAFVNDMYQLPHLAGTITNLDGNELNRSFDSIESEVKRRQKEFNEARKIANESSVDIYKYQKLWREGRLKGKEPIAHLFIISDEFAELKEQQPDFMNKLISIARVGRSLGIHLILSTQKPGGVVDSQIWSNTRFRVCLKVQDTSDSQEVLKRNDAAYLKKTGRFFLQVGTDEVFTLGQSAWAGGQYYPNATFKKDTDTSVNTINNIGFITTTRDVEANNILKSEGEELPNIIKYLSDIANRENIKIKKLWLDKIPDKIYIDSLISKYNFTKKSFYIEPIIGEYDDPTNQNQSALTIPFTKLGNAIIYGISGSGKEMFLTSLIYSCMVSYTPEEVNFYIVDLGAETLRAYNDSPYVGDIVYLGEDDKLKKLFKMLDNELASRKEKFSNYGGTYYSYICQTKDYIPNLIVIINNYESFIENYEEISEELTTLSRESFKYGIYFALTSSTENSVRLRTRQNFSLNYVLQQNNDIDYANILGNTRGKAPTKNKGRGLFKKDNIYEFQTAYVKRENEYDYLTAFCKEALSKTNYRSKKIPVLPTIVDYQAIKSDLSISPNLVVGINKEKLISEKYNFEKNAINLICSMELENTSNFIGSLMQEVLYTGYYELFLINTTDTTFSNNNLQNRTYTQKFDELINSFNNYIEAIYKLYQEQNYNNELIKAQKKYMVIIYGVYDFINKLSDESKKKLETMMKNDNQMGLISFVLVDNPDILKNLSYDSWFKNGCDTTRGIYIGSGIENQSLFKVAKYTQEDREEISAEFGFLIQTSRLYRIKMLSDFNPKDN